MAGPNDIIRALEALIPDPHKGLPEEVFLLFTRNTPMINTDLLIRNSRHQTLLTWRDDSPEDRGWHVPGGIIRYKESFSERIQRTAEKELGTGVTFDPVPLAFNEFIQPHARDRGHFISLLFACTLTGEPDSRLEYRGGLPHAGVWMWHDRAPGEMLPGHRRVYGKFFARDYRP